MCSLIRPNQGRIGCRVRQTLVPALAAMVHGSTSRCSGTSAGSLDRRGMPRSSVMLDAGIQMSAAVVIDDALRVTGGAQV